MVDGLLAVLVSCVEDIDVVSRDIEVASFAVDDLDVHRWVDDASGCDVGVNGRAVDVISCVGDVPFVIWAVVLICSVGATDSLL